MTDPIPYVGRVVDLSVDDYCTADNCEHHVDPYGPVPLCEHHMRTAFVYQMLKAEHLSGGVAETVEPEPAVVDQRPVGERPGFVYFIRFSDRIKIGWFGNPSKRLSELPFDELLHLEPGTMLDERNLHAMFAEHRVVGEWFNDVPEIRTFISQRSVASA